MMMLFRYITRRDVWSWQGAVGLMIALGIFLLDAIFYIGVAIKLARGIVVAQPTIALLTVGTAALIGANATFLGRVPPRPPRKPEP